MKWDLGQCYDASDEEAIHKKEYHKFDERQI